MGLDLLRGALGGAVEEEDLIHLAPRWCSSLQVSGEIHVYK